MTKQLNTKVIKQIFPVAKSNVSLASYLNFGVGGRAACLLQIETSGELAEVITQAKKNKIAYVIVAGGSNVFFADGRINKLVIIYRQTQSSTKDFVIKGQTVECDAAVFLGDLIKIAVKNSLAGLESLAGIPGTVGGAVFGRAGAYGQWISDVVDAVEVWDAQRGSRWVGKKACQFSHKNSIFKKRGLVILRARFKFNRGDAKKLQARSKEIIKLRQAKFKTIINRCAGSFFKNILVKDVPKRAWPLLKDCRIANGEVPTGYLLEQVGALGMKEGKIQVTNFHGNLIINNGGGRAKDVLKLAAKLKKLVYKKYGIKLAEEVRYIT